MTDKQIIIEGTILKIVEDILNLIDEELCEYRQNPNLSIEEKKLKAERISAMRDVAKFINEKDYAGRTMS